MLRTLWIGLLAVAGLVAAAPAVAQSALFTEVAPLTLVITAPFPALVRAAPKSTDPFPATLTVSDGAGPARSLPIQLSARGLTRRTGGYCQFPPLALEFAKPSVKGTPFQGQHKLKLVTYCRAPADFEQRIMLEYLAYRIYNLLTPASYRVRAVEVTYRDSDKAAGLTRFGYLIEDIDELAHRNHAERLKLTTHQIGAAQFDAHAAARAALFEFMIGNLDWDFLAGPPGSDCCHNARFIAAKGASPASLSGVVPIPYDFDYSGFVDAPYAVAPESLRLSRVTERLYRGYCVSSGEIPAVIDAFRARRAEMTGLIDNQPRLTPAFRAKTVRYLDSFFALVDDPARVQAQIVRHCR